MPTEGWVRHVVRPWLAADRPERESHRNPWVFLETARGRVPAQSWNLLQAGRRLADELDENLVVVLLGPPGQAIRRAPLEAFACGADTVIMMEDRQLAAYDGERFGRALGYLVRKYRPEVVLFAAGPDGDDLAVRVADACSGTAVLDCVDVAIDAENRRLSVVRPVRGGFACSRLAGARPQVATLRVPSLAPPRRRPDRAGHIIVEPLTMAERPAEAPVVHVLPARAAV